MNPNEQLYRVARAHLGKDVSPTQNEYGCAESVNTIHKIAFGYEIGGGASTYELYQALLKSPEWEPCGYEPGAIVISPTGLQPAWSPLKNGHAGICGKWQIMSNNPRTYLLDTHLTKASWERILVKYGGFPMLYFRKKV